MPDGDDYLSLFGENSIAGRSVVMHEADGDRFACANIGFGGAFVNESVNTAVASFNDTNVRGTIVLQQPAYDILSDTSIKVDMRTKGGATTEDHWWHVHERWGGRRGWVVCGGRAL